MFSGVIDIDYELTRVWQVVNELSEQLVANQNYVANLQNQANTLRVCLISLLYCTCLMTSLRARLHRIAMDTRSRDFILIFLKVYPAFGCV